MENHIKMLTKKLLIEFFNWYEKTYSIKINEIDFNNKTITEKQALISDFLFFEKNIIINAVPVLDKINQKEININEIENQIYDKITWLGDGWIMPMTNNNYEFVKDDEDNFFNSKSEALNFIINKVIIYLEKLL